MSGFIPTDEEIAAMVRDLEINDPENVNPIYARQMLIKTKLMIRDLGKIYPELLDKEMEEFKKKPTDSKTDDIGD
jgi:hypothetical protein